MSFLLRAASGAAQPSSGKQQSNGCATVERRRRSQLFRPLVSLALLLVVHSAVASAQVQDTPQPPPSDTTTQQKRVTYVGLFVAGGALGLGLHEGGHALFDVIFDADPTFRRVDFHGIPFFALTHRRTVSPRREFVISSAGFSMQHAGSELLLTRRPGLRHERAPVAKGLLAFNVLTSVAYAGTAFARTGPFERDTRGMADAVRIDERVIGAFVLAPAILDTWRYYRPESKWAVWASRSAKAGLVLLVLR
jgi:hypothetical protein